MRSVKMRGAWVRALLLVAALAMAGLTSGCGARSVGVVAAGSTSVQPYAEILAEEFAVLHPGSEVDVQGGGSSAGIAAVESTTADIGMSSRHLKEKEIARGLWWVEIAKDGLAIIVHPSNPVKDLSFEQVKGIYAGKIQDWSELGGRAAKIHLIAREDGSGTRSAFEELVMGDEWITPKAIVQNSNGSVKQLVANDPNAVGFISLGLVNDAVSAVRLGGVEAVYDNIVNGSYALFRPFLFVTNGEPSEAAKEFIDFALSAEGQRILRQKGLIPVAEDANA